MEKCHKVTLICNAVDRLTKTKCNKEMKNTRRQGTPQMTGNLINLKNKNKKAFKVIGMLQELNPKGIQLRSVMEKNLPYHKLATRGQTKAGR